MNRKILPLMNADDADHKQGLPQINADQHRSIGQALPERPKTAKD